MPKPFHQHLPVKLFIVTAAITLLAISSCKKSSPSPGNKSVAKTGISVYITGNISANNQNNVAVYWKDGVVHKLVTDTTINSGANGIAINDTDVYICGTVNGNATCWKNGIATTLANDAIATAITTNGNDVYVAGSLYINKNYVAAYWKNGILSVIGDTISMSTPSSIAVSGADVYVTGTDFSFTGTSYYYDLVLWKNGVKNIIDQNTQGNATNEMTINGVNIYITGDLGFGSSEHAQAVLWENGNRLFLTPTTTTGNAGASTITVNNNIIYVAGYSNNKAAYWTSTDNFYTEHDLTSSSQYSATGITFNNNDMYVSGYQSNTSNLNAVYWKNGTMVNLSPLSSYATAIGVVQY